MELDSINFKRIGNNVLISRKISIYNPQVITIGDNVRIDDFCILSGGKGITLGNYVHIGAYSVLYGGGGIEIDDFSGLSPRVSVFSESDDYSGLSLTNPMIPLDFKPNFKTGLVKIKPHCIIGAHTVILPKTILGEGVSIGANSLVDKPCDDWFFYFGSPVKRMLKRKKELLILKDKFLKGNKD